MDSRPVWPMTGMLITFNALALLGAGGLLSLYVTDYQLGRGDPRGLAFGLGVLLIPLVLDVVVFVKAKTLPAARRTALALTPTSVIWGLALGLMLYASVAGPW